MNATPVKLHGVWGVKVSGAANVGDTVTVNTRAGKRWNAVITRVVEQTGDGMSLCTTRREGSGVSVSAVRPAYSTPTRSKRRVPYNGMVCPNCGSERCEGRFAGQLCDLD